MTAGQSEWNPEPARLREGEHSDDDSHARRNAEQLAMGRTFHDVPEHAVHRGSEWKGIVEAMVDRGPLTYILSDNISIYARYRDEDGADSQLFEVLGVAPRDRWVHHAEVPAVEVSMWLERAEATWQPSVDKANGGVVVE